jgi:hypothetical protein
VDVERAPVEEEEDQETGDKVEFWNWKICSQYQISMLNVSAVSPPRRPSI